VAAPRIRPERRHLAASATPARARALTLTIALALALALVAVACSGGRGPLGEREARSRIQPSFVGRVEGTEAFIGIGPAAEAAQVVAYLSDGDPGKVGRKGSTSEWFVGSGTEGQIDLTSRNGVRLQAKIEGDTAAGTLAFQGGRTLDFTAERAKGKAAGLYREEASVGDAAYLLGWVVLNDGRARGSSYPPFIRCSAAGVGPLGRVVGRICS
jgi:hypothetical protein